MISLRCGRTKGPSAASGASLRAPALGSAIFAATGTGFMYDDTRQAGEPRLEPAPDPHRQHLAGRVLESGDVVEVAVVEGLEGVLHRGAEVGKVAHPAGVGGYRASHVNADDKGVTVEAGTLVLRRHVGQAMRGLDAERFVDLHCAILESPAQDTFGVSITISIYPVSAPVFDTMLGNLAAILAKAEDWAATRKIDPAVLLA